MENQPAEQSVLHEKMRKHFTPLNGYILIEYVRNLKTSGGVYLPTGAEETKSIAHPVVATSSKLSEAIAELKVGDWVALQGRQLDVFKMYDKEWAIIRDFDIMMIVDMNYIKDEKEYKENNNLNTPKFLH
jgi:co-chaperonin GroES (HSP10)